MERLEDEDDDDVGAVQLLDEVVVVTLESRSNSCVKLVTGSLSELSNESSRNLVSWRNCSDGG